jgi:hypothetical protein
MSGNESMGRTITGIRRESGSAGRPVIDITWQGLRTAGAARTARWPGMHSIVRLRGTDPVIRRL